MRRSSSTSSSDHWPWVLGVVCLVEALSLLAPVTAPIDSGLRYYNAATEPTFAESVVQWQVAREKGPADVLVLGDSSALTGVIPRVVERETGMTVQNLGTVSPVFVAGHAALLAWHLERHPPPKWVVYHFIDDSVHGSHRDAEARGMLPALEWWLGRGGSWVSGWPSTRLRNGARAWVGGARYPYWDNDAGIADFLARHGGYLRDEPNGKPWAPPAPVSIHRDALEGIARLVDLTASVGARLLFVRAPIPDTLLNADVVAGHQANERLLEGLAARFPHVRVARPYVRSMPAARFANRDHPDLPGASKNSRFVSLMLR